MSAGSVIAVTGGASGIGRAVTAAFVDRGAAVATLDLDARGAGSVVAFDCDVRDEEAVEGAFAALLDRLGRIDVLVNAAGVTGPVPFLEMSTEEWDAVMEVNARGAFLCTRAAARSMLAGDGGAVVNVGSQAGQLGQPLLAHYCASKGAVIGLTRALARELAPSVRVNAVCPGVVETEMVRSSVSREAEILGLDPVELEREALARIPLGRWQRPESVAEAVVYLAEATDVTGQALNVSGGMVMG